MKVEFLKKHKHRGHTYYNGDVVDVSDSDLVRLIERGVAKKFKLIRPAEPDPTETIENPIGDTDGPATDE